MYEITFWCVWLRCIFVHIHVCECTVPWHLCRDERIILRVHTQFHLSEPLNRISLILVAVSISLAGHDFWSFFYLSLCTTSLQSSHRRVLRLQRNVPMCCFLWVLGIWTQVLLLAWQMVFTHRAISSVLRSCFKHFKPCELLCLCFCDSVMLA